MKKKEKSRAGRKFFRYKKTGRSESEEKKREKPKEDGRKFFIFSPPLAPAFGPSHIQKWSRAHIHADTRSHLLLSTTLSTASPP
jgi:hypothetical protein